ncbi:MAG: hypothetical protein RJA70_3026 [Pseudomonadota bacterium]|jgi:CheY-like chemotaxis protein
MTADPKVLVIDDSEISLEMMVGVLEDHKIAALSIPGPIGATQLVIKRDIHVIVTDVNMPALPGHNLISLFRGNRRTSHVKVILVSSLPEAQLDQLARDSGADGAVQKDRIETDLPAMVRRLLRAAGAESNAKAVPESSAPVSRLRPSRFAPMFENLGKAVGSSWKEITEV